MEIYFLSCVSKSKYLQLLQLGLLQQVKLLTSNSYELNSHEISFRQKIHFSFQFVLKYTSNVCNNKTHSNSGGFFGLEIIQSTGMKLLTLIYVSEINTSYLWYPLSWPCLIQIIPCPQLIVTLIWQKKWALTMASENLGMMKQEAGELTGSVVLPDLITIRDDVDKKDLNVSMFSTGVMYLGSWRIFCVQKYKNGLQKASTLNVHICSFLCAIQWNYYSRIEWLFIRGFKWHPTDRLPYIRQEVRCNFCYRNIPRVWYTSSLVIPSGLRGSPKALGVFYVETPI